jgi:hypothetical protein
MIRAAFRAGLVTAVVALVTGCVVGPNYVSPTVITPDAYKEIDAGTSLDLATMCSAARGGSYSVISR